MYEPYTRQALPDKKYRELLGSAICVFNSNNSFVIENILRGDEKYSWHFLIDECSGRVKKILDEVIGDKQIEELFGIVISMRNRIVHSFQITSGSNQILATKDKNGAQFIITEEYLLDFIKKNEALSSALHKLRGY